MYEKKLADIYYKSLLDNRIGLEYRVILHLKRSKIKKLFREIIENDNYYLVSSEFIKYLSSLEPSNIIDLIKSLANNKNITFTMMKYVYNRFNNSAFEFGNPNEVEKRAANQYTTALYKIRRICINADQDLIWDILIAITANYVITKGIDDSITETIKPYIEDTDNMIDELLINGIIRNQRMDDGTCHKREYFFDDSELAHYVLSKKDDFRKEIR